MTVDGVRRGTGFRRLPVDDRWTGASRERLRGLPWDVTADLPGRPAAGSAGGEQGLPEVLTGALFAEVLVAAARR
eukprot:3546759-Heterocapsa_arctica.AAC.1